MFFPRYAAALILTASSLAGCERAVNEPPARALDAAAPRPPADAFTAHVDRIVDGDTVVATRSGRRSVRVRIIGIDTPETALSPVGKQCFSAEASAYASRLLGGRRVTAAYEGSSHLDKFGRELWDIWLADGTFFAGQAVGLGYARALRVRPDDEHAAYLTAKQDGAVATRSGLWGACPQ